ncbi:sterol-binding protein [Tilletia horrida]|uniref:Sterol-binding protein n=1 Tax=Tilletia horrida TaxID=155126 RepID=A0AAN6GQT8_9BASI|nr:sterol-binding protein [Tilletia horrida]
MAVWTIPFLPFLGPPKTTTFTTTKTGTVTVTTSKTTTASVTSVATATKTISGSTTQFTSITVVPSVTVVPVTTVLTTTQAVPVVSTVTAVVPSTTTVATTIISNIVTTATVVVPVSVTTTTAAATPTLAPTSDPTTPDQQAVVDAHNSYRSKHGVQPLTWNATLAKFAQAQSDRCVWGHSGGPYGENGASGVGFNLTMASAATLWYNEIQNYNFSQPGFSEATGHFTQLIWKSSSTIGCAISQCTPAQLGFTWTGNDPAWNVWCEYSNLPGNIIGQFDTQVLPPLGVPLVNGVVSSLLSTSRSLTAPLTGRAKVRVDREDI